MTVGSVGYSVTPIDTLGLLFPFLLCDSVKQGLGSLGYCALVERWERLRLIMHYRVHSEE